MLKIRLAIPVVLAVCLTSCGTSTSPSHTSLAGSYHSGSSTSVCGPTQFIGNRRSKALHPPGDRNLPRSYNQVCFDSAGAGEAAGYHLVGSRSSGRIRHRYPGAPSPAGISIPGRPHPREEFFQGCPPQGASNGDQLLNLLKNRIDPATREQPFTIPQFLRLGWPQNVSNNRVPMANWSAAERRQVYRNEGMAVSLQGYIVRVKQQGPESTNCGGSVGVDWHVWLAPARRAGEDQAIIVETTPRVRALDGNFSIQALGGYAARGSPMRITGWTMLDYEHPEQMGHTRATLWELHPVTRIEVRRGNQWITVAGR